MIFAGSRQTRIEPPIPLNREEVNSKLAEYYPPELREGGIGGAVLVRIAIDDRGRVRRVRAVKPSIAGVIPLPKPRLFNPATGRRVKGLAWSGDPRLMRAAEEAVAELRFIPGARDGIPQEERRYSLACVFVPEIVFRDDPDVAPAGVLTGSQIPTTGSR